MHTRIEQKQKPSLSAGVFCVTFTTKMLVVCGLLALGLWALHGGIAWDDAIERAFFTAPCTQANPHDCWVISKVDSTATLLLHTVPRTIAFIVGGIALLAAIASRWIAPLRPHATPCWVLFLGLALTAGIVATLKQFTGHYCPAQLVRYGGVVADTILSRPAPRCFPAGHPAAGWGFLPLALVPISKRWRWFGLIIGITFGSSLSLVQMMRGEHFLSHILATLLTALMLGMVMRVWMHAFSVKQPL
jgi:membrane-associated PAP2 superfamily phosphatase